MDVNLIKKPVTSKLEIMACEVTFDVTAVDINRSLITILKKESLRFTQTSMSV